MLDRKGECRMPTAETSEEPRDLIAEYEALARAAIDDVKGDCQAAKREIKEALGSADEALVDAVLDAALDAYLDHTIERLTAAERAKARRRASIEMAARPEMKGRLRSRIEATLRNRLADIAMQEKKEKK
jgi:hypothetical protein